MRRGSINKKLTGEQNPGIKNSGVYRCNYLFALKCIWNKRHLWGAQRSAIMVKELSGFYIKVSDLLFLSSAVIVRVCL